MYLMIQNQGVAPIEAFTMLGDSGTRNCLLGGVIGQFGSGNKHAINMLLRKGIDFRIYTGHTRLEFFSEKVIVTEANGNERESFPVKCRLSGDKNRTIDCGWTLDFGAMDWKETSMALREFVSNALDCTTIMGEDAEPYLKINAEDSPRACKGTTRIFVDLNNQDVCDFLRDLGKHFLHFSDNPEQINQKFLDKDPDCMGPRIYREGVYVRTLAATKRAVYDYNFAKHEIAIDECRNSSEYALRASIGQMVNKAEVEVIAELFSAMEEGDVYESELDNYYLGYSTKDEHKANWVQAWEQVAGDAVIAATTNVQEIVDDFAKAQGHKVKKLKSEAFVKVAENMGVKTLASAIGEHAADGRIESPATQDVMSSVDRMWGLVSRAGLTFDRQYPVVNCFKSLDKYKTGYCPWGEDRIVILEDLDGKQLDSAVLEQIGSHVTQGSDIRTWLIDVILNTTQEAVCE